MVRELSGRVVAITGGARGIGAATARALAREGARVAVGDLDVAAAQAVVSEIGTAAIALPLDVTDLGGFTAFLDQATAQLGQLDVLINNAGIMPVGPFAAETAETATRQIEINLRAVVHGCHEAVRRMLPRGRGHIVNLASGAGRIGFPGGATYCATKHGVVGLSDALRRELHGTGIEVTCVLPAVVRTELTAGIPESAALPPASPEQIASAILGALRRPRRSVHVPKALGALAALLQVTPGPVADRILRAANADRLLLDAASSPDRIGYDVRAAASSPALDNLDGR